jgi:Iodothyronine deiodinase
MYSEFKDRADFLTVYIREAHPLDEWQMQPNLDQGVCYRQPRDIGDRVAIANDFVKRFRYPVPLAIDTMANTANSLYAAWPERLYILDPHGVILYRGGLGPFHYKPEEVRAWLETNFPHAASR